MANTPPKRLQEAFDKWLQAQREALDIVLSADQPGTPTDWAEGFRWVTRMASNALDQIVEKNDPLHPVIYQSQDEFRKFLVDNPDVRYQFARLDEGESYRLWGNKGEAPYLGLTFGSDIFHWGGGKVRGTLSQYYIEQFEADADGNFEIFITPEKREGNWIKNEEGTHHLAVRETFYDKANTRKSVLQIERLGDPLPVPWAEPDDIAEKLETAAHFLVFSVRQGASMWTGNAGRPNVIRGASGAHHVRAKEDEVRAHCDTDMAYMGGRWQLEPGQALKVVMHPPPYDFVYWGLVLVNPWQESYDYRFTRTCTNNGVAERDPDGNWTLVIAPEDPGVPNWLDTGGRLEGSMLLRWVLAGESPPEPTCELVPLDSFRG